VCFVFLLSLFRLENRVCLSHGVQVASAAWLAAMRIVVGGGDLVQRTGDGRTGFLVDSQNQGRRFVSGLASKPHGWFSTV
jgi:hypothetical protein